MLKLSTPFWQLMIVYKPLFVYCFLSSLLTFSATLDTIIPSHSIRDGETLVSAGGRFELGFFSPGNLKGQYLGIGYKISTDAVGSQQRDFA